MPSYGKNGTVEVAFASQKNYISLYILKLDALLPNKHLLKSASVGKGCIRYAKPDKINFAVVQQLLADTVKAPGGIC